jgi:hypothetical protein
VDSVAVGSMLAVRAATAVAERLRTADTVFAAAVCMLAGVMAVDVVTDGAPLLPLPVSVSPLRPRPIGVAATIADLINTTNRAMDA